jgi:Mlc titration factor MtfA (ptsG expression regulator)
MSTFTLTRSSHPTVWQMLVHTVEMVDPSHDPVPEDDVFPIPSNQVHWADRMEKALGKLSPEEIRMIAVEPAHEVRAYAASHPAFFDAVMLLGPSPRRAP